MIKKDLHCGVKLTNRFTFLKEEPLHTECENDEDTPITSNIFLLGKRNIFHLRKVKRSKINSVPLEGQENVTKRMENSSDHLKVLKTVNKFQVPSDTSDEDVDILVKRIDILNKNKRDLKKCKTCNFKKRTCLVDPSKCKAVQKQCFSCNKPGHFPKLLCCKRRIIMNVN